MKKNSLIIYTCLIITACILESCSFDKHEVYHNHKTTFIAHIQEEIYNKTESQIKNNVENRYDWLSLPRMLWQTLITNNEKRRTYAEEAITEDINREDLQNWINSEIELFNKYNVDNEHIEPIVLSSLQGNIVTDKLWQEIDDREWMEWTDLVFGSIIWFIIVFLVGYAIGWVLGFLFGDISGCFGIGCLGTTIEVITFMVVAYFFGSKFNEFEVAIREIALSNYQMWLNNQTSLSNLFMQ